MARSLQATGHVCIVSLMSTPRKTISVEDVKTIANGMLANSQEQLTESREAIAVLLERVLLDTSNYKGYRHIDGNQGHTDPTLRYYY
jgi:hypothetical protein